MIAPNKFETARLVLRSPVLEDAGAIFETYARDPEVTRYLTWRPHQNVERTQEFLRRCCGLRARREAFPWAVLQKGETRLIGMIDLRPRAKEPRSDTSLRGATGGTGT